LIGRLKIFERGAQVAVFRIQTVKPGDLLGTGTVSGPTRESRGCFLELAWRGTQPITLPTGETRSFLEDGDEVIFRGWCEKEGWARIGFGECRGLIVPSA